ncbi:flavin-containing monooxygenase [Streptomyces sp. HMX87]|uniref:flavin-containing monooxygenase n=1 Tax=Streptomyces sp. HMX87 TaxID=3390849 RepID=UPI003A87E495
MIIGAGLSGLGAAIRLRQTGIDDFVVLERSDDVGGTWRDNRYPGAACDVPGHLYAYSFAPVPRWRTTLPAAAEIHAYLRRCVADFGLASHVRLRSEVQQADWNETEGRWYVRAAGRLHRARFLITATGLLSEPRVPDLPGLGTFRGTVVHTARWDGTCDVRGKRVALIGTGASAVQCVPRLAELAEALDVYQRTPPWVLPRLERRVPAAEWSAYHRSPRLRRLVRAVAYWFRESWLLCFTGPLHRIVGGGVAALARLHLRCRVPEPELRRLLTPSYRLGCKRVLLSNDYYPALRRSGVEAVTDTVARVTPDGVVTRDGTVRPADVLVLGTGFSADRPPIARRIVGRERRRLSEAWSGGMAAHRNIMVPGFPNMFLLLGPNSGLGHSALTLLLEAQLDYVVDCLARMRRRGLADVDVLPETQLGFSERLHRRMRRTVWLSGGCHSWYLDAREGLNTAVWPGTVRSYRAQTRTFRTDGHRVRHRADVG